MKKLIALVRNNLLIQKNTFCDVEPKKLKKKIVNTIMMGLFVLCSLEFAVIKGIDLIKLSGIESRYILYAFISMEICLVSFVSFYRILNSFYLTDSWKDTFIYPVSDGVNLLSKFILVCYQNFPVVLGFLIPLSTYGVLMGMKVEYYLKIIIYQVLVAIIPSIYIILSSLTILWIIVVIKKSKIRNRVNKLILIIDIVVDILTCASIMNPEKLVLGFIIILVVSIIGFYFVCGSVYLTIMRSEVFNSRKDRVVEETVGNYKFEKMNIIKSNIIRDLKVLRREKALKGNCLILNLVMSIFFSIFILGIIASASNNKFKGMEVVLSAIIFQTCLWPLSIVNATAITSFSREGSGFKILRTFPIDRNDYIISKFFTACITYIPVFIFGNIFNIAYITLIPYFVIRAFIANTGINNYFEVFILIAINILLSIRDLKKIKSNFKFKI